MIVVALFLVLSIVKFTFPKTKSPPGRPVLPNKSEHGIYVLL